jgi:hypothetical protein
MDAWSFGINSLPAWEGGAESGSAEPVRPLLEAAPTDVVRGAFQALATLRALKRPRPTPPHRWEPQPTSSALSQDDAGDVGAVTFSTGPAPSGFASNGQVSNGSIVAMKIVDQDGKPSIQPGWVSRDLSAPLAPLIVSGVVFAVSSGEFLTTDPKVSLEDRIRQSKPAVLYALEGTSGREIWNSGSAMTSFARGSLAGGAGVVYVTTYDSTVYAFGVPIEK